MLPNPFKGICYLVRQAVTFTYLRILIPRARVTLMDALRSVWELLTFPQRRLGIAAVGDSVKVGFDQ